jgi:hypothetical protein
MNFKVFQKRNFKRKTKLPQSNPNAVVVNATNRLKRLFTFAFQIKTPANA